MKSRNKFNSFRIMTITHRIGSWYYKLKNSFLKCKKTFRIIPFRDSRREKRVFKKICFELKMRRLCTFLVVYGARLTGIKRKRYSGSCFLNILQKRQNVLHYIRKGTLFSNIAHLHSIFVKRF